MNRKRDKKVDFYSWLILVVATLGPLLGVLGRFHWFFDLFSHYRIQELLICFLGSMVLFLIKETKKAILVGFIFILFGFPVLPYYSLRLVPAREFKQGKPIEIIYANLGNDNVRFDLVKKMIQQESPQVLILSEITDSRYQQLKDVLAVYPTQSIHSRSDNFGIAVFSKFSMKTLSTHYIGKANVPTIETVFEWENQETVLWAIHPLPPIGKQYWELRNEQLKLTAPILKKEKRPKIVIGDFNTTPWSYWFGVIKVKGLRDSSLSFGIQPTWPSFWPKFLRIPIDHALVSREIQVIQYRVLEDIGSDHLPILARIGL